MRSATQPPHLVHEALDFLVGVVEVRRHANAGLGPPIAEEARLVERLRDLLRAVEVEADGAAAFFGSARRVDAIAGAIANLHHPRSLPQRLRANLVDADFGDDVG